VSGSHLLGAHRPDILCQRQGRRTGRRLRRLVPLRRVRTRTAATPGENGSHAPGRGPEGIRNLESKTGQNRLLTPPAVARNLPDAPPCNTAPLPRRPLPCFRYIRTLPRPEH